MHIKHMHEMIEKLTDCTKSAIENNETCVGKYPISEVVDMIKDLNEAEYYAHIVKAMKEEKEEEEDEEKSELKELRRMMNGDGRMGYDRYRYANGRFAPRGRGRRMGYQPMMHMPIWGEEDFDYGEDSMNGIYDRMGYSGNRGRSDGGRGRDGRFDGRTGESGRDGRYGYEDGRGRDGEGSRYGRSYDNYRSAKRHYTESKNPEEHKRMKDSIAEVFDDMEDITTEVIRDLTPEEKQRYKQKLQVMMQKIQ